MKRALVLVVLLVAGCAGSTSQQAGGGHQPRTVTVGFAQSGHTVSLDKGDTIVVRLNSTYWQLKPVSAGVLSGGKPTVHGRPGGVPGTGNGTVTASYLATGSGTTTIRASRMSCGEVLRCVGKQGIFSMTVVVR